MTTTNDIQGFRVEVHSDSLAVFGGRTMTTWGARCRPFWYDRAEAWAIAKREMAANPAALVKVYVGNGGRLVWSNRPCSY